MPIKLFNILIVILCFMHTSMQADDLLRGKNFNEVTTICLSAENGWTIYVFEDGSTSVQFGSGPLDRGSAPTGTLNFVELRSAVESQLQSVDLSIKGPVLAGIRNPRQSVILRPLKSIAIWNEVATQLKGKLKGPAQEHFDLLIQKVPLQISIDGTKK